ncbi:MAG: cytochrome b/b6 domain-containing protein [Desulfatitalea sp.]
MPGNDQEEKVDRRTRSIQAWDLPTRIFHWALVLLVITSFVTAEMGGNAMRYHVWSGTAILALLLFRLAWGLVGSRTARFSEFVRGPSAAWRYARGLMGSTPEHYLGHNPLGGWSIVAMLLALMLQVVTGLFANDEIATQGPLYPWVSDATSGWLTGIHLINKGVIIALVSLHLLAVLFYLLVKGDNLITPMISGRKPWQDPSAPMPKIETPPAWVALLAAALSAMAAYLLVR